MPEGMGYPKGDAILGKIKQGEVGPDVAKRPNDKLNMNPNQKVKQGDLGKEEGTKKRVNMVDKSIFSKAEQRDY